MNDNNFVHFINENISIPLVVIEKLEELKFVESKNDFAIHHVSHYENGFSCFFDFNSNCNTTMCEVMVNTKRKKFTITNFPRNGVSFEFDLLDNQIPALS